MKKNILFDTKIYQLNDKVLVIQQGDGKTSKEIYLEIEELERFVNGLNEFKVRFDVMKKLSVLIIWII